MRAENIMANENDKTTQDKGASDKAPPKGTTQEKGAPPAPVEEPVRNLTRDSIEQTLIGKLVNEGKSEEEATVIAKARALKMIPA